MDKSLFHSFCKVIKCVSSLGWIKYLASNYILPRRSRKSSHLAKSSRCSWPECPQTTDRIDNPYLCNRGRDVNAVGTRTVAAATTTAGAHKLAVTEDGDLLTPQGDSLGKCDGWRPS